MKIVADDKIAFVEEAFGNLGELTLLPGSAMTPDTVADADILLVRSVVKVDKNLLKNSNVQFVGTATIGTDHIDEEFLRENDVVLASAPGCNSTAVAEYVLTALLYLAQNRGFSLDGKSLGVVGVGNIGSKVVRLAKLLGMEVVSNDPPLARKTGSLEYRPLNEAMATDIITLHVPLIRKGENATYHLFDDNRLSKLRPGCVLMNTSRGSVVETEALKAALADGRLDACVLDVWENEPQIDTKLLMMTTLATPHIAGYSLEGKVNATEMLYQAVCEFFDMEQEWDSTAALSSFDENEITIESEEREPDGILAEIFNRSYAIKEDDKKLRRMLSVPDEERETYFEQLRSGYPLRREFSNTTVSLRSENQELSECLKSIGFKVQSTNVEVN